MTTVVWSNTVVSVSCAATRLIVSSQQSKILSYQVILSHSFKT